MKTLIVIDAHLWKTPDGKYWSKTIYSYQFLQRYLTVFENISVASRVKEVNLSDVEGYLRVDGPKVKIEEFPFSRGGKQYLKNITRFIKKAKKIAEEYDVGIIRLPSVLGFIVSDAFNKVNKPYAVEVVADPETAYQKKMISNYLSKKLKKTVYNSIGTSYVTKYYLQKKYPVDNKTSFESYYSSINLKNNHFNKPKEWSSIEHFELIHIANAINNNMKGHRESLEVVKILRNRGFNVSISFVGDGSKRKEFEEYSEELKLNEYTNFIGLLSDSSQVRTKLLEKNLLLFPTKSEGLPRVVIESMAVGLPIISTRVSGIPELLNNTELFEPDDVVGMANRIMEIIKSPSLLNKIRIDNYLKAHEYTENIIKERRDEFYQKILEYVQS